MTPGGRWRIRPAASIVLASAATAVGNRARAAVQGPAATVIDDTTLCIVVGTRRGCAHAAIAFRRSDTRVR